MEKKPLHRITASYGATVNGRCVAKPGPVTCCVPLQPVNAVCAARTTTLRPLCEHARVTHALEQARRSEPPVTSVRELDHRVFQLFTAKCGRGPQTLRPPFELSQAGLILPFRDLGSARRG